LADRLRLGFVEGTTPDKWARAWRQRRPEQLELVSVTEAHQEAAVRRDEVDLALVRLPVDTVDLHRVRLYDELPVVVAGRDHVVAAADTVTLGELADEQLVRPHRSGWVPSVTQLPWPPMSEREAIESVAAGTGIVILPMSVARLHHRKDVVHRQVTDLPSTTIALVWRRERDAEDIQSFVGIVKGRTAHTSRS
jgi:DNA-binding transcriptional LysR family regulator